MKRLWLVALIIAMVSPVLGQDWAKAWNEMPHVLKMSMAQGLVMGFAGGEMYQLLPGDPSVGGRKNLTSQNIGAVYASNPLLDAIPDDVISALDDAYTKDWAKEIPFGAMIILARQVILINTNSRQLDEAVGKSEK